MFNGRKQKIFKIVSVLCLTLSLQFAYVPPAEAGLFGIIFFPIKAAKKAVQTTGEAAVRTGGSVADKAARKAGKTAVKAGKKAGKVAIKEASPAKRIKYAKKMAKRARKAGKVAYNVYDKF